MTSLRRHPGAGRAVTCPALGIFAAALVLAPCHQAQAQWRTTVAPSITFTAGYDENPVWRPGAPSDVMFGVVPAVTARRESERASLFGSYRLGADQYNSYPALTSPVASQQARVATRNRFGPQTTLDVTAGFATTLTPTVFNLETAIVLAPGRARRGDGAAALAHEFTPRTGIDVTGRLTIERISGGSSLRADEGEVKVRHDVTPRDRLEVRSRAAWYRFGSPLIDETRVAALGWAAGWVRRLAPSTTVRLAAGMLFDAGAASPQFEAEIERTVPTGWVAGLSVIQTRTPALGLAELVDLRHAHGHLRFISTRRIEAGVSGGLFRNGIRDRTVQIYTITSDIGVPLGQRALVVFAGGVQWQHSDGLVISQPATPVPGFSGVVAPVSPDAPLRRSTFSISLVISGDAIGRAIGDDLHVLRRHP